MARTQKNSALHKAKQGKNDEFYTQLADIELEMSHYRQHFIGKTVFCNCDDPAWSNFWRYFHANFADLGLAKLISTHYDRDGQPSYMMEYTGGNDLDVTVGVITPLTGDGDFRSEECIELLKQADVVVTNPPFSLFREYVAQLMEYGKKFIIIGSQNAITYKEIFPLIRSNLLWLGHGFRAGNAYFRIPNTSDTSEYAKGVYDESTGLVKFRNCCWFTNLDIIKRHIPFFDPESVHAQYVGNEIQYPKYDNYDAINVDKTKDIPEDYFGVMGVPITFLDKYNPDDFEILDINPHFYGMVEQGLQKPKQLSLQNVGRKDPYARILIRRKITQKGDCE